MIIAIDGPAGAGKGTLARGLAEALDFAWLDTGLLYRAVAARVLEGGGDPSDPSVAETAAKAIRAEDLMRADLRDEAVAAAASQVAAQPGVRAALLEFQRNFAARPPGGKAGAVLDGRDVGTVVCPGADIKFYITADPAERARRRHKELLERGEESIYARVLADIEQRDGRDSARAAAPLRPAEDAVTLDTTTMDAEAVLRAALEVVAQRRAR